MTLIPRSSVSRSFVGVWVSACTAVLVMAYVQREIHDMPEAVIWLIIFLTFPAGLIGVMLTGWVSYFFPGSGRLSPVEQFWAVVPYWIIAMVLGFLQSFVALPKLWQKSRRAGKTTKV
jgi:hypothetical protein